jgi:hypothetical protein
MVQLLCCRVLFCYTTTWEKNSQQFLGKIRYISKSFFSLLLPWTNGNKTTTLLLLYRANNVYLNTFLTNPSRLGLQYFSLLWMKKIRFLMNLEKYVPQKHLARKYGKGIILRVLSLINGK